MVRRSGPASAQHTGRLDGRQPGQTRRRRQRVPPPRHPLTGKEPFNRPYLTGQEFANIAQAHPATAASPPLPSEAAQRLLDSLLAACAEIVAGVTA